MKPLDGLYILNRKMMPLPFPLIIGAITIEVEAIDAMSEVEKVEFYIDDELRSSDCIVPYEWLLDETIFFDHTIAAVAYDVVGHTATDEIVIMIFHL
jgi:hypothetical protein